jgi:hypothetical protein
LLKTRNRSIYKFSNKDFLNILVYLIFLNGTGLEDDSEFFSLDRIF